MRPWKTIKSTLLLNDRWLKLSADRCQLHDGLIIDPYYVIHEADSVQVFAHTEDGMLLIVKQFRYAAGQICSELPGGGLHPGETALAAAQRELLEETGYIANTWQSVGSMCANPARQTNSIHLFIATDLLYTGKQQAEASEDIQCGFVPVITIHDMIEANEFSQALHIAAFYRCMRFLEKNDLDCL